MRQHLIDLAAKRDWTSWAQFLPIFGDWLDERGDPEAMACRAAWKLSHEWTIMRYWFVPIPDWCLEWRQEALGEKSFIRDLDGCVNRDWFLHCAPGTLRFRLGIGLSRYKNRLRGQETAKRKPPKSYRFYEALQGLRDKFGWSGHQQPGWRTVRYRVAPGTWEQRREFWSPEPSPKGKIVEPGLAALFWPPGTFQVVTTRASNSIEEEKGIENAGEAVETPASDVGRH